MKNNKNIEKFSQMKNSAPNVEIQEFTVNPMDYHYFMPVFKESVKCKIDDTHGRLVRHLKYTEGEARETTKHCIQQPADIGYDRATCYWSNIMETLIEYMQHIERRSRVGHY